MNSKYVKACLCGYFRFVNGAKYIATEAGEFNSDFLAIKNSKVYEVEIKTSKADFNNDFKKPKHRIYQYFTEGSNKRQFDSVPNYFYFCIPKQLGEYALTKLVGSKYGLMIVDDEDHRVERLYRDYCKEAECREFENDLHENGIVILSKGEPRYGRVIYELQAMVEKSWNERIRIVKKAQAIHNLNCSRTMMFNICRRASSELASLRIDNYILNNKDKVNG